MQSLTESEIVGINDHIYGILWSMRFLEGQGYGVKDNIIYQDNQSAMLMKKKENTHVVRRQGIS